VYKELESIMKILKELCKVSEKLELLYDNTTYLIYFEHNFIMDKESRCDYCKQSANSLFGVFDKMVCVRCHIELESLVKDAALL